MRILVLTPPLFKIFLRTTNIFVYVKVLLSLNCLDCREVEYPKHKYACEWYRCSIFDVMVRIYSKLVWIRSYQLLKMPYLGRLYSETLSIFTVEFYEIIFKFRSFYFTTFEDRKQWLPLHLQKVLQFAKIKKMEYAVCFWTCPVFVSTIHNVKFRCLNFFRRWIRCLRCLQLIQST